MVRDEDTEMSWPDRIWSITGCYAGCGRALARALVGRGETFIATARALLAALDATGPSLRIIMVPSA